MNHFIVNNSVAFSTGTMLYDNYIYLVSKHFCHPKIKPYAHESVNYLHSPSPQPLGTTNLLSISMSLQVESILTFSFWDSFP